MQFKRLRIKDFGPIRDIEFEFEADKVYHFIGENDTGKSMILDAMNILCNNIAGIHVKKYVSDYAENFYVEGEDFDGNIVKIQRGEESWYKLKKPGEDEKTFDKIGGGVPVSIQNIVNVYTDDLKNEKFNFRYSDDKILFMNTTAGENYSFFQKALRTDKVLNSLKKANTLQRGYEKDIDITRSKIEFEKDKLESLPDTTSIKEEIMLYRGSIDTTMDRCRRLNDIRVDTKKIEGMDKISVPDEIVEYNWYEGRQKINLVELSKGLLISKDKVVEIDRSEEAVKEIENIYRESVGRRSKVENIKELLKSIEKLTSYESTINKVDELKTQSTDISRDVEILEESVRNIKIINEIEIYKEKEKVLDKIDKIIGEMKDNKGNSEGEIIKDINILQTDLEGLRSVTQEIDGNASKVIEIEEERNKFMLENRFCPVVANSVNKICPFSNKTLEEIVNEVI